MPSHVAHHHIQAHNAARAQAAQADKEADAKAETERKEKEKHARKSSPKHSLISTFSSPSIFKKHPKKGDSDKENEDYGIDQIVKEIDHKEIVNKFQSATKKVVTSRHMHVPSQSDIKDKKKKERADLIVYALFMFFFTLNTIDGLGDQAGYKYTETLIETLNLVTYKEIVTYDALTDWLDVCT